MARPTVKSILGDIGTSTSVSTGRPTVKSVLGQDSVEEQQKQPRFIQSMAKALVKPFARLGATGASAVKSTFNLGQALAAKARGNEKEYQKQLGEATKKIEVDLGGYLGKFGPMGAGEKLSTQLKQGFGTGAEIGSWFIFGGGAKNLVKGLGKAGLSNKAKQVLSKEIVKLGAKEGAKVGASAGGIGAAGATLAEKESTAGDVLKAGAIGTVAGGVLGAGIGALGGKISAKFAKPKPIKPTTKPIVEATPIVQKAIPEQIPTEKGILPTKQTGVAKSIEAKSIERGLTEGFGEVAEFNPITIKQQSKLMSDIMTKDIELAKRIATGKEPLPPNLKGATAIKAMEDYAMETGDGLLARDLARSPLLKETSEAGQTLRLLAEREPDSATAKIRELALERTAVAEKKLKGLKPDKIKSEIKAGIKQKVAKVKANKYDWKNLISEIQC